MKNENIKIKKTLDKEMEYVLIVAKKGTTNPNELAAHICNIMVLRNWMTTFESELAIDESVDFKSVIDDYVDHKGGYVETTVNYLIRVIPMWWFKEIIDTKKKK